MSNLFQEVLQDAQGVQEKLLGPSYPYYKKIKTPSEIGMSDKGTLQQMAKNIDGLRKYIGVLSSGNSGASVTGKPLGNQFFLQTGGKCVDKSNPDNSKNQVDRYIYVNNIPLGNIPFISGGLGVNFSEFKGLIPGAMGNLNVLNPFGIMQAFLAGSTPECQEITLKTVDVNDNVSSETHFVTTVDIQNMDPCVFPKKKNPLTGDRCRETFQTSVSANASAVEMPDDAVAQLYFAGLAFLGIYILHRFMEKSR